jgi:hypothetical protein
VGRLPNSRPTHDGRERGLPWVTLPSQPHVEVPPLPDWRKWHSNTIRWWAELWAKPQASQWESYGAVGLIGLAMLWDDVFKGTLDIKKASPEIRQREAAFGLTPRAMVSLRWRYANEADEPRPAVLPDGLRTSADRRRRLMVVDTQVGA